MSSERRIFTIGHSTHEIGRFINLLKAAGVTAVSDVRSAPYSRFSPQFNRESLETSLRVSGIAYVWLGRELGARTDDPSCYERDRVVYKRLARTDLFKSGLNRIERGASTYNIAVLCAEREPLECHRTLLISRELVTDGLDVIHILADGRQEEHAQTMQRLVAAIGLPDHDLFRSIEQLIDEACARQEERIAYVRNRGTSSEVVQ